MAWIFLGRLVFVSAYLPRWLGVLLALAGLSTATGMVANIVAPDFASSFFLLPTILAMLVLAILLLVRGVDERQWEINIASSKSL
ncbi:MAG TPA: DUF4386 family protein [Rhizomicrobium sp.]|jgi:hypothetical protein|nr:DUF4386 family protein [Rhizomicrobium sp.]